MPRCKTNSNQFVAGMLPTVTINNQSFFVDGRLEQLRNVNDFSETIDCVDDYVFELLSNTDKTILIYEFTGETINY
jgi:hypothetical protein